MPKQALRMGCGFGPRLLACFAFFAGEIETSYGNGNTHNASCNWPVISKKLSPVHRFISTTIPTVIKNTVSNKTVAIHFNENASCLSAGSSEPNTKINTPASLKKSPSSSATDLGSSNLLTAGANVSRSLFSIFRRYSSILPHVQRRTSTRRAYMSEGLNG